MKKRITRLGSGNTLSRAVCLLCVCCLLITALPAIASGGADLPKPGDLLTFGRYEQDNDLSNGPEPITWRVLLAEEGKALIISEKCLDAKPYNTEYEEVTWETSTLRAWLNGDFLTAAFTADEQKAILTASVENKGDPASGINFGRDTSDKVFLLSNSEAEGLFSGDDDRRAQMTAYAMAQEAYEYDGHGFWWLRSTGYNSASDASSVDADGCIGDLGVPVEEGLFAVRPALYIDTNSLH